MNIRQTFGLISLVFLFSGCSTPPPEPAPEPPPRSHPVRPAPPAVVPDPQTPLTFSLLQRLRNSVDTLEESLSRFQFIISGKVVLEREYSQRNDTFEEGGIPEFEDEYVKVAVTINDQTPGQAVNLRTVGERTVLSICFEEDDDNQLSFSYTAEGPDEYFYLEYIPNTAEAGEEQGSLIYGGNVFKLFTGETRPYLLINLSQKDIDTHLPRTAPGRRRR